MKPGSTFSYDSAFNAASDSRQEKSSEAALARLARIPGLNMMYCQSLLGGNADKYLELLTLFIQLHANDMTLLVKSLADGDDTAVYFRVHSLKGTAATLGIDNLAGMVRRLEALLRGSQYESVKSDAIYTEINAIKHELVFIAAALSLSPTISNSYYDNLNKTSQ